MSLSNGENLSGAVNQQERLVNCEKDLSFKSIHVAELDAVAPTLVVRQTLILNESITVT